MSALDDLLARIRTGDLSEVVRLAGDVPREVRALGLPREAMRGAMKDLVAACDERLGRASYAELAATIGPEGPVPLSAAVQGAARGIVARQGFVADLEALLRGAPDEQRTGLRLVHALVAEYDLYRSGALRGSKREPFPDHLGRLGMLPELEPLRALDAVTKGQVEYVRKVVARETRGRT